MMILSTLMNTVRRRRRRPPWRGVRMCARGQSEIGAVLAAILPQCTADWLAGWTSADGTGYLERKGEQPNGIAGLSLNARKVLLQAFYCSRTELGKIKI